jgi:hypothetical protein
VAKFTVLHMLQSEDGDGMDEENMEQQERIKDRRQRGRQFRDAGRTEYGWEERTPP